MIVACKNVIINWCCVLDDVSIICAPQEYGIFEIPENCEARFIFQITNMSTSMYSSCG